VPITAPTTSEIVGARVSPRSSCAPGSVRDVVIESQRHESSLSGKSRKYMVLRAKRQVGRFGDEENRGKRKEIVALTVLAARPASVTKSDHALMHS